MIKRTFEISSLGAYTPPKYELVEKRHHTWGTAWHPAYYGKHSIHLLIFKYKFLAKLALPIFKILRKGKQNVK